ncbi:MAG TPA: AI-2E family transporter [Candidatus Udaeobacter sp.]|jgi:predicted PurR-regulated permease PerM|nr:AI-2E family transporter [Candidatus Udaeobacter sp.]
MNNGQEFEKVERERKLRRTVFYVAFATLALIVGGFLIWKLSSLILPIIVGGLLAFVFRPVKDSFKMRWLPHEVQVLCSFAAIGVVLFFAFNTLRKHIPDEEQKLEFKVRLKYKLNEKYQQLVANPAQEKSNAVAPLIQKEVGPLMDRINQWLELNPEERDLFLKYAAGYEGKSPIEGKFVDYFRANQQTGKYVVPEKTSATAAPPVASGATASAHSVAESEGGQSLESKLSAWILAPLIFVFLGFDNGQIRRFFIGLVPNRYFELSLTVLDRLDVAIGRYLRGTLTECFLVGLTLTVGLILLGLPVEIAVTIGVLSGLLNAIPFLGTVMALVIGVGYALVAENIRPLIPGLNPNDLAVYVVILVVVTHILDDIIFQPFVLGSAVNVHPLVVVIAIIGGSLIMGLWGMLFAIPTVVVVNTAVATFFKELKAYRII